MARAAVRLSEEELTALVEGAVRERLAPFGYREAAVREGRGFDGEPTLFGTVYLAGGNARLDSKAFLRASAEASARVWESGEDRPLSLRLSHRSPEEAPPYAGW